MTNDELAIAWRERARAVRWAKQKKQDSRPSVQRLGGAAERFAMGCSLKAFLEARRDAERLMRGEEVE